MFAENANLAFNDQTLTTCTISLLRDQLVSYLAPLILHSIMVAEQAHATSPEVDPEPAITAKHVEQALTMRDEDPTTAILNFLEPYAQLGLQEVESDHNGSLELPFRDVAVLGTAPQNTDQEHDHESDSDVESTLSDQEDLTLDEAMGAMDEAYDDVYNRQLWERHESHIQPEDWDDPWNEVKAEQDLSEEVKGLFAIALARRTGGLSRSMICRGYSS